MKQLFIDPGSKFSGHVWFENGEIWNGGKDPNKHLTAMIYAHKPSVGVVEMPKTYRANPDVDATLIATGRFLEALDEAGAAVYGIPRRDVLKILFGCVPSDGRSGRNNDREVWEAMQILFPKAWVHLDKPTTKKNDAWQALGLREAYRRSFEP